MDLFTAIPPLLTAFVGGFLLMNLVGIQALISLFSSAPLARRHRKVHPDFDLSRAFRRIIRTAVVSFLLLAVITTLIVCYASALSTFGYLLGTILSFLVHLSQMSPNNRKNQRRFERTFADCYLPSEGDTEEFDIL